jgi:hypothetical protein
MTAPHEKRSATRRWLIALAAIAAGCVAGEFGYRWRRSAEGRPYDRAATARALAALAGQYIAPAETTEAREIVENAIPGATRSTTARRSSPRSVTGPI